MSSVEEEDADQSPGPGAYDQTPLGFNGEIGELHMSTARSAPSAEALHAAASSK